MMLQTSPCIQCFQRGRACLDQRERRRRDRHIATSGSEQIMSSYYFCAVASTEVELKLAGV